MKRSELVFNSKNDFIFFCKKKDLDSNYFLMLFHFLLVLIINMISLVRHNQFIIFIFKKKIIIISNRELHRAKILWHCLLYMTEQRIGILFP